MIYLTLFLEFFKIGLFCFGGAFGMIPLIEETVTDYGWITENQFYDFIGVCESTPGPIAVNMATYIGSTQGGFFGSICATLGVVMPSFIIILLIASIIKNFTDNKYFKGFIKGVKPVIAGLIISTGLVLTVKTLVKSRGFDAVSAVIFLIICFIYFGFQKIFHKKLSSIWLIIISAFLGIAVSGIKNIL
ncbi:MAG: chromate transporter [Clostridia bacterium]|nr:chromate transporter [Clostridia bacterium]